MILDQQTIICDSIMVVPDWSYSVPSPQGVGPGPLIQETIVITGSNAGTSISITGIANNVEG